MEGLGPVNARAELWKGRPVLVTGAAGFLGSWLVKALVERQAAVVALVRDQPPQAWMLQRAWADRVTFVRGDVTDPSLCERVLAEYGVEVIFHLAAQSQVGVARMNPAAT
ncbi:MAG TPA: SDR family NAD(P)-dependent oxidoreductase, partial [Limnochorda sp.]